MQHNQTSLDEPDLARFDHALALLRTDRQQAMAELQALAEIGSVHSMLHLAWELKKTKVTKS